MWATSDALQRYHNHGSKQHKYRFCAAGEVCGCVEPRAREPLYTYYYILHTSLYIPVYHVAYVLHAPPARPASPPAPDGPRRRVWRPPASSPSRAQRIFGAVAHRSGILEEAHSPDLTWRTGLLVTASRPPAPAARGCGPSAGASRRGGRAKGNTTSHPHRCTSDASWDVPIAGSQKP